MFKQLPTRLVSQHVRSIGPRVNSTRIPVRPPPPTLPCTDLKPIGRQYSEQPRLPETTTGQNNHGFKDTFRKLPFIVRLAIYCISIYIAFWFGLWVMIAVLVAIVFVLALFDIALQPAKYRKIE